MSLFDINKKYFILYNIFLFYIVSHIVLLVMGFEKGQCGEKDESIVNRHCKDCFPKIL